MQITGKVVPISSLKENDINRMHELMSEFYDNIPKDVFFRDLLDKEYCVIVCDKDGRIQGFSTLKILEFSLQDTPMLACDATLKKDASIIRGVFSGDSIVHKKYWGSIEGLRNTISFCLNLAKNGTPLYWFLIVKGYKTYKILPTFFKEFYPNYHSQTPQYIQNIMDSFGNTYFPKEYNQLTGVVEYKEIKDTLKSGVADITQKRLLDKDIQFFLEKNSNYLKGHDLVCITQFAENNLRDRIRKRILL